MRLSATPWRPAPTSVICFRGHEVGPDISGARSGPRNEKKIRKKKENNLKSAGNVYIADEFGQVNVTKMNADVIEEAKIGS